MSTRIPSVSEQARAGEAALAELAGNTPAKGKPKAAAANPRKVAPCATCGSHQFTGGGCKACGAPSVTAKATAPAGPELFGLARATAAIALRKQTKPKTTLCLRR